MKSRSYCADTDPRWLNTRLAVTCITSFFHLEHRRYQTCLRTGLTASSRNDGRREDGISGLAWSSRCKGMLDALTDVERMLDVLEGDYKTVLIRRYLLNESYETIAERLNYSDRQIYRMHNKAINVLVKKEAICRKL